MVTRCTNPNHKSYSLYGGKGISVCQEWSSIDKFVPSIEAAIGPRPSQKHSLDRIDSNGNYEPGNVRWATQSEQLRNQSRNRLITFDGETLCLTDWALRAGLEKRTLHARLTTFHWPIEKALTTPARAWSGRRSPSPT
jgi:hypothetical protein